MSYANFTIVLTAGLPAATTPQALADSVVAYLRGVHDPIEIEVRVMRDHYFDSADTVIAIDAGFAQHPEPDDAEAVTERTNGGMHDGHD